MSWGMAYRSFGRADLSLSGRFSCVMCEGARRMGGGKWPSDSGPFARSSSVEYLSERNIFDWWPTRRVTRRVTSASRPWCRPPQSRHRPLLFTPTAIAQALLTSNAGAISSCRLCVARVRRSCFVGRVCDTTIWSTTDQRLATPSV